MSLLLIPAAIISAICVSLAVSAAEEVMFLCSPLGAPPLEIRRSKPEATLAGHGCSPCLMLTRSGAISAELRRFLEYIQ